MALSHSTKTKVIQHIPCNSSSRPLAKMPTALATSKRKFYKLLDNLNTSRTHLPTEDNFPSSSTTTLADGTEPPTKRSRFLGRDRPTTAPGVAARPLSLASVMSTTTVTAAGAETNKPTSYVRFLASDFEAKRKRMQSAPQPLTMDKLPPFAPWSNEQFLQRLKTFADVRSWTPKPEGITEVEWAKRGWALVSDGDVRDTIWCRACKQRLVVILQKEKGTGGEEVDKDGTDETNWWSEDVEKELVERYKGLIIGGHEEGCLWREKGCSDDIYRIRLADPNVWQPALKERYLALMSMSDALPEKIAFPEVDSEDELTRFEVDAIVNLIPPSFMQSQQKEKENAPSSADVNPSQKTTTPTEPTVVATNDQANINSTALALAICGWTGQTTAGVSLAYCTHCFQRCGLWLYSPKSSKTKGSVSLLDDTDTMTFHPVDLHRQHCPWKNVASQAESGVFKGLSAWQVQVHLVKNMRRRVQTNEYDVGDEEGEDENLEDGEELPAKSWEEIEKEDRERESRLRRLKKAFTIKKVDHRLSKRK